eukprot:356861-Chlamydomonas_euryale.AAC.10
MAGAAGCSGRPGKHSWLCSLPHSGSCTRARGPWPTVRLGRKARLVGFGPQCEPIAVACCQSHRASMPAQASHHACRATSWHRSALVGLTRPPPCRCREDDARKSGSTG